MTWATVKLVTTHLGLVASSLKGMPSLLHLQFKYREQSSMALNPIFTFGSKALLFLLLHLCIYLRLYIISGLHQANMLWFSLFSNELITNEGLMVEGV